MILSTTLLTGCTKDQDTLNTHEKNPTPASDVSLSDQNNIDDSEIPSDILNYIIIKQDNLHEVYQNDSSDSLRNNGNYGLVADIEDLMWIASRGLLGLDKQEEKSINELPVIQESFRSDFGKDVKSKNVWIRLNYEPYVPEQGMNVIAHKDLIVYLDPQNQDNAFLGIQNVQDLNTWTIILMPGYGPWFEKEINMLLYFTTGCSII